MTESLSEQLENRTDKQVAIIHAIANNPDATNVDIAEQVNSCQSYVWRTRANHWDLVQQVSNKMEGPSSEAVNEALNKPEEKEELVADGAGERNTSIDMTEAEVFRCIRLLPADLASIFYTQISEKPYAFDE